MSDLTPDDLRRLREITEKAVNHRSAAEWASASELADGGWLSESAGYIAALSPDTALLLLDMAERTARAEAEVKRMSDDLLVAIGLLRQIEPRPDVGWFWARAGLLRRLVEQGVVQPFGGPEKARGGSDE